MLLAGTISDRKEASFLVIESFIKEIINRLIEYWLYTHSIQQVINKVAHLQQFYMQ